jgi:hypothetical protein
VPRVIVRIRCPRITEGEKARPAIVIAKETNHGKRLPDAPQSRNPDGRRGGETEASQNESVRGQSKRYPIGTQIKTEGGVSLNLNATFYTNRPSLRFECKSMLG